MTNTTTQLKNELVKLTEKRNQLLKLAVESKDFDRSVVQKAFHNSFSFSYHQLRDVFGTAYVLTKILNRKGSRFIMPNGMIVRPNKLKIIFPDTTDIVNVENDEILYELKLGQKQPTIEFKKAKGFRKKILRLERHHLHCKVLKEILERFTDQEIDFIYHNLGNTIENSSKYRIAQRDKNFGFKNNYEEPELTQLAIDIQDTNDKIHKLKKIIEKHRKFLIQNKWVSQLESSMNDLESNIDSIYKNVY